MPNQPNPNPPSIGLILNAFLKSSDPEMPSRALLQGLLAFMCWPEKEDRSKVWGLIAVDYIWLLDLLKALPVEPGDTTLSRVHGLADLFFGGWQSIQNLPREKDVLADFHKRLAQGKQAGAVLCLAHTLHTHHAHQVGDISLRKVFAFLARNENPFFSPPPGADALKTAWEASKSLAHLWAGLFFVEHWMPHQVADAADVALPLDAPLTAQPRETVEAIAPSLTRSMLAVAAEFQKFGTSYTPNHARKPLLELDPLWVLRDIPASPLPCPNVRLSDDDLAVYDDYRS